MSIKFNQLAADYFQKLNSCLDEVDLEDLNTLVKLIWSACQKNQNIFFIGNGGSASTATHLAADLAKSPILNKNDPKELRLKCLSLTDNPAWITAISNDISFQEIFVEQLKNLAQPQDLVVFISGSGNSDNLVKAALYAKQADLRTVGLLGFNGGYLKQILDHVVLVPVNDYGLAESAHSVIHHYLVDAVKLLKKENQ